MKTVVLILALLVNSQSPLQPDREQDGFVGRVKKVVVTSVVVSETNPRRLECPQLTKEYDRKGRVTRHSVYRGECGSEEIRKIFTYSPDGARDENTRKIVAPNSPLLPPPRANSTDDPDTGVEVMTVDETGRLIEAGTMGAYGRYPHKTSYFYDAKGRLLETRTYREGAVVNRSIYRYSGEERVPSEVVQYNSDNRVSERTTYSEYEFNAKGDWVKRKEAKDEAFKERQVFITHREIAYYTDSPTRP